MKRFVTKSLPFVAMMVVESVEAGLITLSKAAMSKGMSNFVFVVYYNALGTLFLFPSFSIHFFSAKRPPVTFALLSRFFLLGLIGICLLQILAYAGINYSSPTLAAAIGNLIPAFTFILAVSMGMEKLDLSKLTSQAKSLGTIVAISGASVMTLYKGPPILTASDSLHMNRHLPLLAQKSSNWALGGLLLIITSLLSSTWNVLQTATAKEYPDQVIIVFFFSLFGTIQSGVASFFLERKPSKWKIHNNIEIIAILYAALAVTVFRNSVVTWCLHDKGPVYVAMYKPLSIVISAFMAYMFLGDSIYLGSLIGASAIAVGFYAVIWGQTKEKDTNTIVVNDLDSVESNCNPKTPLLQRNTLDLVCPSISPNLFPA
ncbi:hypothetical protein V2J09_008272 [Rumex salicifolius]